MRLYGIEYLPLGGYMLMKLDESIYLPNMHIELGRFACCQRGKGGRGGVERDKLTDIPDMFRTSQL